MPKHTLLVAALSAALATPLSAFALDAAAADVASPDTAAAGDSKTLAAVRVTGSNIKRTDTETANPVQVIGRQEIEATGKATVADLLRSISANTGNANNETTNNGWASGSAGIGLRGLSQKNTLVLLNGRRLANYGFPAGGLSDTFVNLNALPMVAVERIEVLKDGASAVYGSDAVAGVVNIITRQDFQGAELGASAGTADQGGLDEQNLKFIGGIGDLDADGYNILVSLEGYNRERLDQDQRDLTRSGIYTDKPGGRWNGWSAKGARFLVNGTSVPMLDANGQCPENTTLVASAPIDGLPGNTCGYNLAPYTTLIPSTKRYQAYVNGTFKVNDNVEAFGEVIYSEIKGVSWFGSSPFFTLESGRFALNADIPGWPNRSPTTCRPAARSTRMAVPSRSSTPSSTWARASRPTAPPPTVAWSACAAACRTGTGKSARSARAAANAKPCPAASPTAGPWPMRWPPAATTCSIRRPRRSR